MLKERKILKARKSSEKSLYCKHDVTVLHVHGQSLRVLSRLILIGQCITGVTEARCKVTLTAVGPSESNPEAKSHCWCQVSDSIETNGPDIYDPISSSYNGSTGRTEPYKQTCAHNQPAGHGAEGREGE